MALPNPLSNPRKAPAPLTILGVGGMVAILLSVLLTHILATSPWLGVRLEAPDSPRGLAIVEISDYGPLARKGLTTGDLLVSIKSTTASGEELALNAVDIIVDPALQATYAQYHQFFERQDRLWKMLNEGTSLKLTTQSGKTVRVEPAAARPVHDLPWQFWYQIVCAGIALLAGLLVSAFRNNDPAATYYGFTGIGIALVIYTNACFSGRELALEPHVFIALSKINWLGVCCLGLGLIGTLWFYPKRISSRFPFTRFLKVLFVVMLCWDLFEVPSSLEIGQRYPLYAGFVFAAVLASVQWYNLKDDPVGRASMRWFIFSWFAGTGAFIGLILLPLSLGLGHQMDYVLALGFLPLLQLGIALGILRYRLFDLDRWAMLIWLWFIGGLLVILADAILIYWLNVNAAMALSVSLLFVGWVYFPLRQYFWKKLGWYQEKVNFQQLFPKVLSTALSIDSNRPAQQRWEQALAEAFKPLSIENSQENFTHVERIDHGLTLCIPGFKGVSSVTMTGASRGTRLMGPDDEELVTALRELFNRVQEFRSAFEDGVLEERQRVARDLHDDIAADLLTMIYQAPDEQSQIRAQKTFSDLRAIIQNMAQEQKHVNNAIAEWRSDVLERCAAAGIEVIWSNEGDANYSLPTRYVLNLRRAIREIVSNVIRHSDARRLMVDVNHTKRDGNSQSLCITLADDGVGIAETPTEGSGLNNIKTRITELNGSCRYGPRQDGQRGTLFNIEVDVVAASGENSRTTKST